MAVATFGVTNAQERIGASAASPEEMRPTDGPHKGKLRAAETSQMQCERRVGANWFFIEIDVLDMTDLPHALTSGQVKYSGWSVLRPALQPAVY